MSSAPAQAPAALAPPPGHPRFPLFDSVRAMAALGVVVFHCAGAVKVIQNGRTGDFMKHLDVGVTLFFLISGFLLYRPYAASREGDRPAPRLRDFLRRRALRIVPGYWFALTIAAFVIPYQHFWGKAYVYYGFGQVYSDSTLNGGLFVAWTLCAEVVFYLALPLYAHVVARGLERLPGFERRIRAELGLLALLALASVWARSLAFTGHATEAWAKTFFTTFAWFAVGMSLALVSVAAERRGREPRLLRPLVAMPALSWGLALVVFVAVAQSAHLPGVHGDLRTELVQHVGYALIAALVLVPAIFEGDGSGFPRRFLAWPVMAWLGLVSYGIYLWHPTVAYQLLRWKLPSVMADHPFVLYTSVTILLTVGCAAVSYYLVERPALRFKDRRRRPDRGAGGGEPLRPAPAPR